MIPPQIITPPPPCGRHILAVQQSPYIAHPSFRSAIRSVQCRSRLISEQKKLHIRFQIILRPFHALILMSRCQVGSFSRSLHRDNFSKQTILCGFRNIWKTSLFKQSCTCCPWHFTDASPQVVHISLCYRFYKDFAKIV